MVVTDEITRRVLGGDTILILAAPAQGTCQGQRNKAVAASLGFWFTGLLLPGRAFFGWVVGEGWELHWFELPGVICTPRWAPRLGSLVSTG